MTEPSTIRAVLTGDIVNSTKLSLQQETQLRETLREILHAHEVDFFRGDSLQVFLASPRDALRTALICRTAAILAGSRGEGGTGEIAGSDIRISIGIGEAEMEKGKFETAKGEAFLLSGRSFDEMKKEGARLLVITGHEPLDTGLAILSDYVDAIYSQMTGKQAAVIYALLKGETQQQASIELHKSKSTISQMVHAARWPEIEKLLGYYEKLVAYLPTSVSKGRRPGL